MLSRVLRNLRLKACIPQPYTSAPLSTGAAADVLLRHAPREAGRHQAAAVAEAGHAVREGHEPPSPTWNLSASPCGNAARPPVSTSGASGSGPCARQDPLIRPSFASCPFVALHGALCIPITPRMVFLGAIYKISLGTWMLKEAGFSVAYPHTIPGGALYRHVFATP